MSRKALLFACSLSLACSDDATVASFGPESAGDTRGGAGVLTITPAANVIAWDAANFGGPGIVATLRNSSTRDYYANVGDAFNSSLDQDNLAIAGGTGASILRQTGTTSWTPVPVGMLIEGSRVVRIRAGGVYELRGFLSEPRVTGTMRIQLRYFSSQDTSGVALVDYSTPFTVR